MRSRRLRLPSLLGLTATLLAGSAFLAPAARANTEPVDLSSVEAITAYLSSKGIDTSNLIVQEGTNNYYGIFCPGEGWDCLAPGADEVVIQRTTTGENIYEPGSAQCVVVQTAETADNQATCSQYHSGAEPMDFSALVTQQNVNGNNTVNLNQTSEMYDVETMSLTELADVHQQIINEGTGANSSTIYQDITESSFLYAPVIQTQLSSQGTTVDQFADSGANYSNLTQYLLQSAHAIGYEAEQHQNDSGEQEYMRNSVNQHAVSGTNESILDADTEQYATIAPYGYEGSGYEAAVPSDGPSSSPSVESVAGATQMQGCVQCGVIGTLNQDSAGVSTATATLDEFQEVMVDPTVESPMQVQIGPVTVPTGDLSQTPIKGVRCCSDQSGNPENTFDVTISSTQIGDHTGSEQRNYIRAACTTSGSCTAGTTVNQDGVTTTESCTGSECSIAVQCPEGDDCSASDTAEPETSLTTTPPTPTSSEAATFGFTSTEPGGFICALDEGAWEACSSPKTYTGLLPGSHLFRTSGVDIAGNVDQTPAAFGWLIETLVDTTIDSSPPTFTNKTKATLSFHGSEEAASFECKLDSGAWEACTSPKTYLSIGAGQHLFQARALDGLGNADGTPARAVWIVDLGRPTSIFTTRTGSTKVGAPFGDDKVAGKAFDSVSGIARVVLTYKAGGVLARTTNASLACNPTRTSCMWESSVFGLPPGNYTVTQQAFDRAGNSGNASSITIIVV
jgi:hypothetical protein